MNQQKQGKGKVGTLAGVPYDWRKPTKARWRSRVWNPDAPFVTKRWWGWGYDLNLYRLFHPGKKPTKK
jgi:hypothetical protein